MRIGGIVVGLALLAGACSGSGDAGDKASASVAATEDAVSMASTEATTEAAPPPKGRSEKEETELYEFAYSYPDAAAGIEGLRAMLDRKLDDTKGELVTTARGNREEAKKDGYPYHAHSMQVDWKVVTDLPGWLSLSAEMYQYSGGAHGMSGFDTLVWDRGADTARKPMDFFTGQDALRSALQAPFCNALDKEREKKRGEPVRHDSSDMFAECIDPTAQTLILGSTNGKTFDRIGILVAPYEAGPYAEGSYEVTLPVTGKVMAALKPQYRSAFSVTS